MESHLENPQEEFNNLEQNKPLYKRQSVVYLSGGLLLLAVWLIVFFVTRKEKKTKEQKIDEKFKFILAKFVEIEDISSLLMNKNDFDDALEEALIQIDDSSKQIIKAFVELENLLKAKKFKIEKSAGFKTFSIHQRWFDRNSPTSKVKVKKIIENLKINEYNVTILHLEHFKCMIRLFAKETKDLQTHWNDFSLKAKANK